MPYTHGGDIYGDAAVELDFSVNTNRLGMPQAVRDAVMASAAAWEQYPDALCRKLRRAAAAFYEADGTPIPGGLARVWKRCFGYFICSCLSDSAQTGDFAGTGIFGV
ncbi:MAG: hypothetical protein ACLR8P_08305 [Clostridium fessum]